LDGVPGVDRGAYEYDRDDLLGLRFMNETLLNWGPIPGATSYHVCSGSLHTLLSGGLDTCRDSDDADLWISSLQSRAPRWWGPDSLTS
jgi:hypothetical protein